MTRRPRYNDKALMLRGVDEFIASLEKMEISLFRKADRTAVRRALLPVRKSAKAAAPELTGNLKKGIKLRVQSNIFSMQVAGAVRATAPHSHLIEFGHRIKSRGPTRTKIRGRGANTKPARRNTKDYKTGYKITHVAPIQFMRPAWDVNKDKMLNILAHELAQVAKL